VDSFHAPIEGEYIEHNLARFFHVLRHLGLRISSSEAVDAVNAVFAVNMLNRNQVKTAFLATLAKNPEDRVILDQAFQAFFVTPEQKSEREAKYREVRKKEAVEIQAAEEELKYSLEGPEGEGTKEISVPLSEEEKKIYTKLPEEKKVKLKDYLKKPFQSNQINNPEELIAGMIKSSLNYWKYYLKFQGDGPPEVDFTGDDNTDEVLQEVVEKLRNEDEVYYQDIQKITETDMPLAAALISKLSRRLAMRISRRYKHSKKKQRLDLRRTIRHNIAHGGIMFKLKYKTKKVQKPQILLICDVSGSMARHAGFVLQFMYGLTSVMDKIESFIFSEQVDRITDDIVQNKPFEAVMAEIINHSESWGRGTDFANALQSISEHYKRLLNKETFIIIVSDTKTLNLEKASLSIQDIKKRVKDILWLNTLPRKLWSETSSVSTFKRHCRMFECNTLAHLDRIMRVQMLK
jgi:uncharacterized protein with von Willebrand factor type A (vWA) domain